MLGAQVPVIGKVPQEEKGGKERKEKKERSANMANEDRMLEDNEIDPERSERDPESGGMLGC